jgi:VWFA-related protein
MAQLVRILALGAVAFALCPVGGPRFVDAFSDSQGAHQIPSFKSRLDLIRTEVAVIDNKTGKPLLGLAEHEFSITENGVRQTISSFVDKSRTAIEEARASSTAVPPSTRRVFLFVVGAMREGPYQVYSGVSRFIRERLRSEDLVGVMALGRLTDLTTDHERVAAVVERLRNPPEALLESQLRDRWKGTDISPETERLIDSWLEPASTAGTLFRDATGFLLGTSEYQVNTDADIVRAWKRRLAINDILKVVAGIEYLRRVEGEKHLFLVTAWGFNPPITFANEGIGLHYYSADDDRRLAARANDAGVAVDIVQTVGPALAAFSIMSSQNVSEHSGGQFSGNRTTEQQLGRIDDASRSGYILGHVPTNPLLDGRYREVRISVSRKNVTLVYRKGYTARAVPEPINSREIYTRARLRDAAVGNSDLTDIPLSVKGSTTQSASGRQARVDLTLGISTLPLTQRNGRWEGEIDLLVLLGDAGHNVVGKLEQRMTLSMDQATYEKANATGVPYSTLVPVSRSASSVKVVVYHFDSDRLGTATASVR